MVEAADDNGSRAMMVSSIAVARAMNMFVTAEGVETQAQAAIVRTAGCDQIQGWLYYKAIPADEITRHLATAEDREDKRRPETTAMDMSHTPEVPQLDELERDRAERLAHRRASDAHGRSQFGTGTIAQRMRTVIASQTFLAVGNGVLAASALAVHRQCAARGSSSSSPC